LKHLRFTSKVNTHEPRSKDVAFMQERLPVFGMLPDQNDLAPRSSGSIFKLRCNDISFRAEFRA